VGAIVLKNLSEAIRDCLQHAEDCARTAAALPDGSSSKQDYLDLEKRWLKLARSFQVSEQLTDFTNKIKYQPSAPITPFLRDQAFDPETVAVMGKAFVLTCDALGLSERTDAKAELVAGKIIELARRGLKDPSMLCVIALTEVKPDR